MHPSQLSKHASRVSHRQRGVVLIVSLVILLVLTVLGISGMQNTTLEERMTGNYRDRFSAFQAAEAGLRAGESALADATQRATMRFDGTDGTYSVDAGGEPVDPLEPSNYVDVAVATLNGVVANPQLFIERLPVAPLPQSSLVAGFQAPVRQVQYYRVTARGTGSSGKADVILQSTYRR